MYPLLISGITSLAGNLLDRWAQSTPVQKAPDAAKFSQALLQAGLSGAGQIPPETPQIEAARLRQLILRAPEVATMLAASSSGGSSSIQISPDGRLLVSRADGSKTEIGLAPETQSQVQRLAALLNAGIPNEVPRATPQAVSRSLSGSGNFQLR